MCILFAYISENPMPDSYKVILAVNRDETYRRPTESAHFWGTTPEVLGAKDMEPGREGGTWLAISKTGRIAALLNVLQSRQSLSTSGLRRGRGFLVNNFLLNPSLDASQYLSEIQQAASEYNPFNLLTIDVLHKDVPQAYYYSCSGDQKPRELPPGNVYGIGNSFIDSPFLKVSSGKKIFADVVKDNNNLSKTDSLINGIMGVLKNEEKFHPDPQMQKQGPDLPENFLREVSCRFIKTSGYGTRTHTVILIDFNNQVTYRELTLLEPINERNPEWISSSFSFKIEYDGGTIT